jgi:dTMP kinase
MFLQTGPEMFITLEGIEGAGKSCQLPHIETFLRSKGHACITTREPGGTAIGGQIRSVLLNPSNKGLVPAAELLLYVADRIQHIRTVIEPHLAANRTVLCDRFFDATLVYQGYARGLDKNLICQLHALVCDNLQPDLTLLFDLEPETGLARAWRQIDNGDRTGSESRFEQEAIQFHRKVRAGYRDLASKSPQRFRIIDAGRDIPAVTQAVQRELTTFLASHKHKAASE